jgi:putative transposase
VFFADGDRREYIVLLKDQAKKHGLEVLGYCLMANHVHLVATPREQTSLANAVGSTHWRYTQYVNRVHGRSGHLWQNRFYSCPLGERHAVLALRYVEQNPVRAGLTAQAWEYPWSSAAAHAGEPDPTGLLNMEAWKAQWTPDQWREYVQAPEDETIASRIQTSTGRGWPLGSESFLEDLEQELGRRVRPLPPGRPKLGTGTN